VVTNGLMMLLIHPSWHWS